jgi:hypothetical protein
MILKGQNLSTRRNICATAPLLNTNSTCADVITGRRLIVFTMKGPACLFACLFEYT